MLEYFEIGESSLLLLLSLVFIKISNASFLLFIPFFFLFLGSTAMKNALLYELNRIYFPGRFSNNHRDVFKIALLFILFSVISAYYLNFGIYFLLASLFFTISHAIKVRLSFLADLIYSLSIFFIFLAPYYSLSAVPFAWVVSLAVFLRRIAQDLARPFGIERLNLPKILGIKGTKNAFLLTSIILFFWLALPALFYRNPYSFLYAIPFSFLAISDYLVFSDRIEEAQKLLYIALITYALPALFL